MGLPNDVPIAFFHAPKRAGGLRIISFVATILRSVKDHLERLRTSAYDLARMASESDWAVKRGR